MLERDDDRAVGVTVEGIPVEVIAADAGGFGTALLRATGSPEYVASLGPLPESGHRGGGVRRHRPVRSGHPSCVSCDAADPPPDLLELEHVRGDLHMHSTASDGKATVLELGLAARELGYEYIAICDHTKAVRVVEGLDADGLRRQAEEIAAANEELAPFRILRGSECDILPDGSLDLPDDVLAELDWVQISLHAGQRAAAARADGARASRPCAMPATQRRSCLSHPLGRILNHRPENALDLDQVFEVALETGVALEVNGLPDRLDLSGTARPPRARGRREDRLLDRRPLRARARQHGALGRDGAARRRAARRRPQHAPARGAPYAAVAPGPRAPYSRTSNQCVARSASATSGSVCSA